MKKSLYAVILAGGRGTRFWPISRKSSPKQFLHMTGKKSLLQETLLRVRSMVPEGNIFLVTSKQYASVIKRQTKGFKIPSANILFEPEAKNTAPSIAWAAFRIYQKNPEATMVVLPSDHMILKKGVFTQCIKKAIYLASKGFLVTLGIVPTRPETGYGYLQTKKEGFRGQNILKVQKFIEKPNAKKAQKFLDAKKYLWNSGMFVWKAAVIIEAFKRHQPVIYKLFSGKGKDRHVQKIWGRLPKVSVDYGILEHAMNIVSVPAKGLGWSDLGSWESLFQVFPKDKEGNVLKGDVISVDNRNSFIVGDKRLVATIGLENIIVVDTPDSLLVCRKDLSQKVRDITEILHKEKRKEQ